MEDKYSISRRALVKSSAFGLLTVAIPNIGFAKNISAVKKGSSNQEKISNKYPSIDDAITQEVVSKSHFDLDRIKELVGKRPELARDTWDWGFGDWETAIGAASHVGRRDIAKYLLSKGAIPDIYTYAMFGAIEPIKALVKATPGIQSRLGPHGINLLSHAKAGMRMKDLSPKQIEQSELLIAYLEELGDADLREKNIAMSEQEKQKYVGDYYYGDGPKEGFSVKINMRKMLSLGKLGEFGGGLFRRAENVFIYNGTQSVEISFDFEGDKVNSLTIKEPDLTLTANKV